MRPGLSGLTEAGPVEVPLCQITHGVQGEQGEAAGRHLQPSERGAVGGGSADSARAIRSRTAHAGAAQQDALLSGRASRVSAQGSAGTAIQLQFN